MSQCSLCVRGVYFRRTTIAQVLTLSRNGLYCLSLTPTDISSLLSYHTNKLLSIYAVKFILTVALL